MKGDFHVRFREKFAVKLLLFTRLRGRRLVTASYSLVPMFRPSTSSLRACVVPRRNAFCPSLTHRQASLMVFVCPSSLLQYLLFVLLHTPLERCILPELVLGKSPELRLLVVTLRGRDIL